MSQPNYIGLSNTVEALLRQAQEEIAQDTQALAQVQKDLEDHKKYCRKGKSHSTRKMG
jgi:hypothetical protein